jgi:hypothetical protein
LQGAVNRLFQQIIWKYATNLQIKGASNGPQRDSSAMICIASVTFSLKSSDKTPADAGVSQTF